MKNRYILIAITLSNIYFTGCTNTDSNTNYKSNFATPNTNNETAENYETILYIREETILCDNGEAREIQCLQTRDTPSEEWKTFYEPIEEFDYEEGYRYKLNVKIEKIDEPMADSSDRRVILIKILDKTLIENGIKYAD